MQVEILHQHQFAYNCRMLETKIHRAFQASPNRHWRKVGSGSYFLKSFSRLLSGGAGRRRQSSALTPPLPPSNRASYVVKPLVKDFLGRLQRRSMWYSNIHIRFGDFLKCQTTLDYLQQASLVWVNNVAFAGINFR